MRWQLDQLSVFISAAEQGSFSAAARRLGRAQSAVSTAIALLEAELGILLFDRSGRTPVLTAAGTALLAEAREVLLQADRFHNRAQALAQMQETRLTLAFDEALPWPPMLTLLQDLAAEFPQLEVTLLQGSAGDIANWTASERADLGIVFSRARLTEGLETVHVGRVPRVLVAGAQHPLAAVAPLDRRALARHRQLLIASWFPQEGEEERISPLVWRSDSFYTIAELVGRGVGWAVMPINVAQYGAYAAGLKTLDCSDLSFPPLAVHMVWRRGYTHGQAARWTRAQLPLQLARYEMPG